MTRPGFAEGLLVALVVSLAGSVGHTVLAWSGVPAGRLVLTGLALGYLLYLLGRSPARAGRATTALAWTVAVAGLWSLGAGLGALAVALAAFTWLARSLHFHRGVLPALADLGLTVLGLAAALWALLHTGSVFLGLWCFFLIQSLFVLVPQRGTADPAPEAADRFEQAHRRAEAALRRLADQT